ncbi:MAG TPA: P1 family peptidase, partial [Methylomirabilota bacterium]|nr:P1 family peptidase [Methylomirabilota bacterium]
PVAAHALMIPGLRVGHVTDAAVLTGCTVILSDAPAIGGVEIRGWAAGVHGLEFLDPRHLVPTLDGVVLAGGSAFGLEAIWGVMQYLEERGVGFRTSQTVVPHVAGAILYDLGVGDARVRPDRAMGYRAAAAARPGPVEEGNVGAGTGATVGKIGGVARATKGGLGCAVGELDGVHLGAIMAVNAVGDVRDPETGRLIAGARDAADGRRLIDTAAALAAGVPAPAFRPVNTTIGLVATTAALDKVEAGRVARLAMDGFTRALSPPHLATDGDTLFCLSVGTGDAPVEALGRALADLVARAIVRGVRAATGAAGLPAARDL